MSLKTFEKSKPFYENRYWPWFLAANVKSSFTENSHDFRMIFMASIQKVATNDAPSTRSQSIRVREVVLISVCRMGMLVAERSMTMAVTPQMSMTLLENGPRLISDCFSDLVLKARKIWVSIHEAKAAVCAYTRSPVL